MGTRVHWNSALVNPNHGDNTDVEEISVAVWNSLGVGVHQDPTTVEERFRGGRMAADGAVLDIRWAVLVRGRQPR
jgi:hypothetical protein